MHAFWKKGSEGAILTHCAKQNTGSTTEIALVLAAAEPTTEGRALNRGGHLESTTDAWIRSKDAIQIVSEGFGGKTTSTLNKQRIGAAAEAPEILG